MKFISRPARIRVKHHERDHQQHERPVARGQEELQPETDDRQRRPVQAHGRQAAESTPCEETDRDRQDEGSEDWFHAVPIGRSTAV
jgi:hypothetical protein